MNVTLDLPQARRPSLATILTRISSLYSVEEDRDTPVGPTVPAYSFTSDCECPDDCLRDHDAE